ncbi:DUF1428 family protein [Nisaea sp.]|uniref:DUF1428 domain-containing protein n=1 Tax=Nisaea sp. TaxID=2024842 RepID=UPI0032ED3F2E
MGYVSAFVASVPTAHRQQYIDHCKAAAEVIKEAGALSIVDCWGDDVPDGEVTSFPMAVKKTDDETVVFGWIVWPSKEVCDAGMQKMMTDSRMDPANNPMPFDGKRLIFGGFDKVFEA